MHRRVQDRRGRRAEPDCRLIGTVNSIQAYWDGAVEGYRPAVTVFFSGSTGTGCGAASRRRGSLLLPRGRQGLRRPRVLRGPADAVRGGGGSVRGGVRARARVRASRAGPPRHARPDRRRPGGSAERRRPLGAPGGLLRGGVGRERGRHGVPGVPRRGRDRPKRSTRPRPWATTASSGRRRGRSTARRGRTAPRRSASGGS